MSVDAPERIAISGPALVLVFPLDLGPDQPPMFRVAATSRDQVELVAEWSRDCPEMQRVLDLLEELWPSWLKAAGER